MKKEIMKMKPTIILIIVLSIILIIISILNKKIYNNYYSNSNLNFVTLHIIRRDFLWKILK